MTILPPIVSGSFPASRPGPHKSLGYSVITATPRHPWSLQSPTLGNGKPALNLSSIGYAVYYPCSEPRRGWFGSRSEGMVDWLSDPKREVVRGYQRFLGQRLSWIFLQLMKVFVPRVKFRANRNAPLRSPPGSKRYPLVIFSHGLAGTRTTYSQYCSALASEGYVVLSIEHKDGSGPMVRVRPGEGDGEVDGILHYTKHTDLQWEGESDTSLAHFRTLQLQMRVREVYETYHSFKQFISGDGEANLDVMARDESLEWLASMRDRVDFDELHLTGHSFGGATILDTLQTPPPDDAYPPLPITKAVALDPWLEPLATPSASQRRDTSMPPILVLNSPGFTVWTTHFQRLVKVIKGAQGSLMTIMKGNHQSFSDFPLLLPPTATSLRFLKTTHELSVSYLRGSLASAPVLQGLQPDEGDVAKDEKGKMAAQSAVVVHLLGKD